ncbi:hypothetical protein GE061_006315 [Apolygus lucorum]|uniref:Major facilitator superfamily (MFS) profile domain-containing protein n=1 Tax=Apolygus lucorum TaxID=248454 RepID=A0A8S9WW40_APOLU|nr:hypothetical protein GE061_006315 [Apolygus lucorum]
MKNIRIKYIEDMTDEIAKTRAKPFRYHKDRPSKTHASDYEPPFIATPSDIPRLIRKSSKMTETKNVKKVPPDGGWGWVVVFAFAMNNIVAIPVLQNFGLLFRNIFVELNLTATDVSTIINVNSASGLFVGLINGPLLKKYGFRKFALLGAFLLFFGFLVTAFATSMWEFIIFYGLINSIGLNILMSSFSLAMNTYFLKRRSIASGFSSTLTGLGPVFMPLLISKSIEWNSARGTALLLAGLLLHSVVAAMLLQPVKWHMKTEIEDEELQPLEKDESIKENGHGLTVDLDKTRGSKVDLDQEALDLEPSTPSHMLEGVMYPRRVSIVEKQARRDISQSRISLYDRDVVVEPDTKWWNSKESVQENRPMRRRRTITGGEESATFDILMNGGGSKEIPEEKKGCWQKIVKMFDLDLLKDPVYFNIWLGMSIAFTGEINFSLMTPIILGDRQFDISETARIMSTIAVADILFRFVSPFIGYFLKLPPRQMYMISLVMLAATRFSLTCVTSYYYTLLVAVGLGVAKGFRTVYMTLVIPNQVPLEKLASASGLQTVLNGLFLFAFGPVVGILRDAFGTFDVVIHLTNVMSLVTVTIWSIEMLIKQPRFEDFFSFHDRQRTKMNSQPKKNVPPDGGWGYVVVFATATMGFLAYPVIQNFGLLFRPIFSDLELSASEISTIINVNSGAGFIFGVFHGPLTKIFGYRKYAMVGAAMFSVGLLVASHSNTVYTFIIFYGILNSIGFCIIHNAFTFSLNSYFLKKRTAAVGIAFMIAGIGSVITPLILSQAIAYLGARYTAFLLSGIVMNIFAAAMLLQPVKWHYKFPDELEEGKELVDLKSETQSVMERPAANTLSQSGQEDTKPKTSTEPKQQNGFWRLIVHWFDLDLLKDPIFISIFIGLSFAYTGEITFSLMYPIVLGDKGFDIGDTATIMATTACVDIIFRIIVPVVEKMLKWKTRDMYMLTIIMLIMSRFTLTGVNTYWHTMMVAAYLGVAKGFRTVYMTVVLANYVPIEKLPSAQGIQTLFNGLMLLAIGPVVGKLRDYYGNFEVVIHLTNFMSLITLCIWALERLVVKIMGDKKKNVNEET